MWAFLFFFFLSPFLPTSISTISHSLVTYGILSVIQVILQESNYSNFRASKILPTNPRTKLPSPQGEWSRTHKRAQRRLPWAWPALWSKEKCFSWGLSSDPSSIRKQWAVCPEVILQTFPWTPFPLLQGKSNSCLIRWLQGWNKKTRESTTNSSSHFIHVDELFIEDTILRWKPSIGFAGESHGWKTKPYLLSDTKVWWVCISLKGGTECISLVFGATDQSLPPRKIHFWEKLLIWLDWLWRV